MEARQLFSPDVNFLQKSPKFTTKILCANLVDTKRVSFHPKKNLRHSLQILRSKSMLFIPLRYGKTLQNLSKNFQFFST